MHEWGFGAIFTIVILALVFDFINGFHDTANAIATTVTTGALRPPSAILLASLMNFAGALTFTGVAKTVGEKIINTGYLENGLTVIIAALMSSIVWNLATWFLGLPSSSSHALIGSLAGAALTATGIQAVNLPGLLIIIKILLLSPLVAFTTAFIFMSHLKRTVFNRCRPRHNKYFKKMQVLAAAFQAFTHGTNDAQKTMGIITLALLTGGFIDDLHVPLWVKVAAALAMALGTSMGGWRIIATVGRRITRIEPQNGLASDINSAMIILTATMLHMPVSTTHIISSSIAGTGSAEGVSTVRWVTVGRIIASWVLTLPVTAIMAGLLYKFFTNIL